MAKILRFHTGEPHHNGFTPEARQRWEGIPPDVRELLLANAYCAVCKDVTTILQPGGTMDHGALVLRGHCATCGHPVARVVD